MVTIDPVFALGNKVTITSINANHDTIQQATIFDQHAIGPLETESYIGYAAHNKMVLVQKKTGQIITVALKSETKNPVLVFEIYEKNQNLFFAGYQDPLQDSIFVNQCYQMEVKDDGTYVLSQPIQVEGNVKSFVQSASGIQIEYEDINHQKQTLTTKFVF